MSDLRGGGLHARARKTPRTRDTMEAHSCLEIQVIRGMLNFRFTSSRSVPLSLRINHLFNNGISACVGFFSSLGLGLLFFPLRGIELQ